DAGGCNRPRRDPRRTHPRGSQRPERPLGVDVRRGRPVVEGRRAERSADRRIAVTAFARYGRGPAPAATPAAAPARSDLAGGQNALGGRKNVSILPQLITAIIAASDTAAEIRAASGAASTPPSAATRRYGAR